MMHRTIVVMLKDIKTLSKDYKFMGIILASFFYIFLINYVSDLPTVQTKNILPYFLFGLLLAVSQVMIYVVENEIELKTIDNFLVVKNGATLFLTSKLSLTLIFGLVILILNILINNLFQLNFDLKIVHVEIGLFELVIYLLGLINASLLSFTLIFTSNRKDYNKEKMTGLAFFVLVASLSMKFFLPNYILFIIYLILAIIIFVNAIKSIENSNYNLGIDTQTKKSIFYGKKLNNKTSNQLLGLKAMLDKKLIFIQYIILIFMPIFIKIQVNNEMIFNLLIFASIGLFSNYLNLRCLLPLLVEESLYKIDEIISLAKVNKTKLFRYQAHWPFILTLLGQMIGLMLLLFFNIKFKSVTFYCLLAVLSTLVSYFLTFILYKRIKLMRETKIISLFISAIVLIILFMIFSLVI